MSNARIQFSTADESKWLSINPNLREGELVLSKKDNGRYKMLVGGPGGSDYKTSTLIWDQDNAEAIKASAEDAKTTALANASTAASSAETAVANATIATQEATSASESASAAANSASMAAGHSITAQNKAAEATNSAETASTAAINAANSQAVATQKASDAGASATTATQKAAEAANSASAANDSAIAASAAEAVATQKASEAIESANTAAETAAAALEAAANWPEVLPIKKGGTGANNAYDAAENLNLGYKQFTIKADPSYAYIPSLFKSTNTSITLPVGIELNINGEAYISTAETTLLISTLGTAAELAGKDVYIYACQGEGTEPGFTLSLNSTVPNGYTADNSRKIGGFHCECLAIGSLTNVNPVTGATEAHKLTDLGTGEIIAPSCWDLWHKPTGKQTEGMSYVEEVDIWIGIYGASWDGTKLVHTFGGIWADGTSTKKWHGELSLEALMQQGMRLPWRHEFQCAAKGSNEQTNIKNSADPGTTGAHVDTAGRRMVSNYGLEDCCGVLWQWLMDLGFAGGSGWTNSAYDSGVDPRSYGQTYGTLFRLRGGGVWSDSASCGSRCAACANPSARVSSILGCRGASEPLHRKGEKRKAI